MIGEEFWETHMSQIGIKELSVNLTLQDTRTPPHILTQNQNCGINDDEGVCFP
jgi:hypothetical protein